jgi:hypothetical protein
MRALTCIVSLPGMSVLGIRLATQRRRGFAVAVFAAAP